MSDVFLGWFQSPFFANVFIVVVLIAVLTDAMIPRLVGGRGAAWWQPRDRGSFLLIQLAATLGLVVALALRYRNVGLVPPLVQVLAVVLILVGAALREWAIVLLGRFFSRTVDIEPSHRLVIDGPYRWIRHPAYTGMILMDTAIVLGLGTWAGALFMLVVILAATLYRIRVEEQALVKAFADEYRTYMRSTWRLFPGW